MLTKYLDAECIIQTIATLEQRILQRFPDSGLGRVCGRLEQVARQATRRAEWIAQPIWRLRIGVWLLILLVLMLGIIVPLSAGFSEEDLSFTEFVQVLEAGLNELVLVGALFIFLFTLEIRVKRSRALKAIHELRSIAHIIDMHQLTKDPERVVSKVYLTTEVSPRPNLDRFQLRRYLDYCSEMLSLTGKIAALYVQDFEDSVSLAAVNEVESLTTGLSRKIWQKIMILHSLADMDSG